jgi:cytochrome c oxidase subunit 3
MNVSVSNKPITTAQVTLLLVLAAETTLFGTLLMAYLYLRTSPAAETFTPAPLLDVLLAGMNTVILLMSAFTAHRAMRAIRNDNVIGLNANLTTTLALGLLFVFGQAVEFSHSGMAPDDPAFGGVYFTLIGFHALHVLAGGVVLVVNRVRAQLGDFDSRHYVSVQVGMWFWYYVVAVWLVLYAVLYVV